MTREIKNRVAVAPKQKADGPKTGLANNARLE
jgi:hypothetical protein